MAFNIEQQKAIAIASARQRQASVTQQPEQVEQPQAFNLEEFSPGGEVGGVQPQTEPESQATIANLATEFVAGVNRPVLELIDIFGVGTVNAALEKVGSEKRFGPLAAPKGQFAGSGLATDIAAGAGELATLATGAGALLKAGARAVPAVVAGETGIASTAKGVVGQLGTATPLQNVSGGILAGAGQEVGEEFGGETGRLVGGVLTPVVASVPLNIAKNTAKTLINKATSSIDELKTAARGIYKSIDEAGVSIPARDFDLLADDIARTLKREGADVDLTGKAIAVINRFQSEKGANKTLSQIDTLRKVAKNAADSFEKSEQRLGVLAINKVDDFLDGIGSKVSKDQQVGEAFKSARDLWGRARKAEILEEAVLVAQNQASGLENGLRTQFRQIANRIDRGKLKGFTEEEKAAIDKVNQGTNAGNIARFLGKFGILDGITSRSLTTIGGAGLAGAATGEPLVAAAVPLIGQLSGALAQRMTQNNAAMASAIIRAGKNSNKITSEYIKRTPKSERSATELAELFIANKVPVNKISVRKVRPIIADAAIIASIARSNDEKEAE